MSLNKKNIFKNFNIRTNKGKVNRKFLIGIISIFIVFLSVYAQHEIKSYKLNQQEDRISKESDYSIQLNRYNKIKDNIDNDFYSDKEKLEINSIIDKIKSFMSVELTNELKLEIDKLEKKLEELNSPIIAFGRSSFKDVENIDEAWLTDNERQILNEKRENFISVFNSKNESEINKEANDLEAIHDKYNELINKRKYDSESIVVREPSYINGVLVVNKHFALPASYNYGEDKNAREALNLMKKEAKKQGIVLRELSGFRSYKTQAQIYSQNVREQGEELANMYSAKAGQSEHQAGLAFDLGGLNRSTDLLETFGDTKEGKWLQENAHKYGFILRYMKDKEDITGYAYEPWHFRYVGIEHSTTIHEKGVTLEEYLGLYPY